MTDIIRFNTFVNADTAPHVLKRHAWYLGDCSLYTKTQGACLEHPAVADIAQALDVLGINWECTKDRQNNVTFIIPESAKQIFDSFGIAVSTNPNLPQKNNQWLLRS